MATTDKHGLVYPSESDEIADYPATAKTSAEKIDQALPPTGGNADQVLAKVSGSDYATAWIDLPQAGKDPQVDANADALSELQIAVEANTTQISTNANAISDNTTAISDLAASLDGGDIGEILTKTGSENGAYDWLPGGGDGGNGDTYPGISADPQNRIELDPNDDGKLIVRFPEVRNLTADTSSGDVVLSWED